MKDEYCLVLAGGGTKGAYQVGAWKAIQELGIRITAIAGTSIGAINGALMVQGNTEQLERIYDEIDLENVISTSREIDSAKNIFNISNIVKIAADFIKQRGFTNDPLRLMLEQNLDLDSIYNSPVDFGMVTFSIKDFAPVEIFKKDIKKEELIDYLLASACFPIYKAQKIGENKFLDGGFYDNLPINMLIEKGHKRFIVIDLEGLGLKRTLANKNIYIKQVRPNEPLGGTFEFNKEKMKRNSTMGYLDTMKAFGKLQGHRYYFKTPEFNKLLNEFTLQTISGLETAAQMYGMELYQIYTAHEFLTELITRHRAQQIQYRKVKDTIGLKSKTGILDVLKEHEKIRGLAGKGLALSFFADKLVSEPTYSLRKEITPFSDYISASRALFELENWAIDE